MALYHSAKGSVDYTVVGTPTIVDGVASGFSSSDYLKFTSVFNKKQNWEICFDIGSFSYDTVSRGIFCMDMWSDRLFVNRNTIQFQFSDNDGSHYLRTPEIENFKGKIKIIHNNNHVQLLTKIDGGFWTLQQEMDTNFNDVNFGQMYIGQLNKELVDMSFDSSIDLNETYITVNGQPWFGNCPVEVKKHQLRGPVGYTVVGSPTIVDGVASGFSESNYLTLPAFPQFDDIEFVYLLKSGWNKNNQNLLSFASGKFFITVEADNTIQSSLLNSLTGQRLVLRTDNTIENINDIYIKVYYSNNSQYIATSENGQTWNNLKSSAEAFSENIRGVESSLFHNAAGGYFHGSIDLNNTYIKVNGKLWFYQPAPTKYIVKDDKLVFADQGLYLTGPVNYTVSGSLITITDNVVSGFANGNFLSIRKISTTNPVYDFEINVKFTLPPDNSGTAYQYIFRQRINSSSDAFRVHLYRDSADGASVWGIFWNYNDAENPTPFNFKISSSSIPWGSTVTANFKCIDGALTGTLYNASGTVINTETYSNKCGIMQCSNNITIGANSSSVITGGSVDLKETYIKVNGDLWFYGKNYATKNIAPVPAGYTYGNTTTSAIGWVDMRTQVFTAAPSGATIGRDE